MTVMNHPLRLWRKKHKITQKVLAEMIGDINELGVRRWEQAKTRPSFAAMKKIIIITDGMVTPTDFVLFYEKAAEINQRPPQEASNASPKAQRKECFDNCL